MRKVDKKDVTWRDTAFLTKFMNETGKIINKYQSRLPSSTHRKVARSIKRLRDLELVAHVGMLKPTDKIPVGSFVEDLEEMHKKTIDPVTGRLFLKHSLQDSLADKERRVFGALEERIGAVEPEQDEAAALKQSIMREMSLDGVGLVPTRAQRQWLIAQAHVAERNGALEQAAKEAELLGKEYSKPATEFLAGKQTYEQAAAKVTADPNHLFDQFLSEKSLNVDRVT